MMSSSQTNSPARRIGALSALFLASVAVALVSGCIADTAEDSDLPWASNKNWEGLAPIAPSVMNQYD